MVEIKLKVRQDHYRRVRKVKIGSQNQAWTEETQLRQSTYGPLQLWDTLRVLWIGSLSAGGSNSCRFMLTCVCLLALVGSRAELENILMWHTPLTYCNLWSMQSTTFVGVFLAFKTAEIFLACKKEMQYTTSSIFHKFCFLIFLTYFAFYISIVPASAVTN